MPSDRLPNGITGADPHAIARGYESRDVKIKPFVLVFVGMMALFAVLCGGLWFFYRNASTKTAEEAASMSAVDARVPTSDAPPLQPQVGHEALDAWDLQKMREQEDATFAGLGWTVDRKTHRVAVPASMVDALRARQAARQTAAAPTALPATSPAEGGR